MGESSLRWRYLKSSFGALFGMIWAVVGTVLFLSGLGPAVLARGPSAGEAVLEGRVVQKGEDADKDGQVRRWIGFVWRDQGGEERSSLVETSAAIWAATAPSDILLLAPPEGSETSPRILEPRTSTGELLVLAGIGLVVGGIGWGLVIAAVRKAGRRAHLVTTGKLAQATVTAVEEVTNVRINRRHPLVLCFEFRDDSGERRRGRSPYLPRALEERWQPGGTLRVVYDPIDPERFEADIFDARAT